MLDNDINQDDNGILLLQGTTWDYAACRSGMSVSIAKLSLMLILIFQGLSLIVGRT